MLIKRPRRLRNSATLRHLVRETRLSTRSLIWPVFVKEGSNIREEIASMPGQYTYSVDYLADAVHAAMNAGVYSVILFGIPDEKDELGTSAWVTDGIVQKAVQSLRAQFPELLIITDVCLCEYTAHGHCGVLSGNTVNNDVTLPLLAKTALSHVEAGADMVAPSDMMDGRIGFIRNELDQHDYSHIPIMSYSVKYASAFYGPFRVAANSTPVCGDRKGYQMDAHNVREALREATLDIDEGADILMVKPALSYLDVIRELSVCTDMPLAAYSVSGEYAMIKAAAKAHYIDEYAVMCESALSIYRAGADILITYYAQELAQAIMKGDIG